VIFPSSETSPSRDVPTAEPDEAIRLAKEGVLFSILAVAGKVSGYLREWLVAFFFGAGIVTDAYRVAVDFLRSLTGFISGSTFESSLVPLMTRWRVRGILRTRALLFRSIAYGGLLLSLLMMVLLVAFADLFARLQAPDFTRDQQALIAMMLRWIAPAIPLFIASSMLTILLMSVKRYRLIGYVSLVMNSIQIVAIALIGIRFLPLQFLPMSYWISIILLIFLLAIDAKNWWLHEKVRLARKRVMLVLGRFTMLAGPLMIVGTANQVRLFMDRRFVSEFEVGAIAALYFARFIAETPAITVGRTLTSMALPHFSELVESKRLADFRHHFLMMLDYSLWLLVPAVVFFASATRPIVDLVFGYGAFDDRAVEMTTLALVGASPMLWTLVFQPIPIRVLIAQERVGIVLPLGLAQAALNITLAWWLGQRWEIFGISIALSISQLALIVALLPTLRLQVTLPSLSRILLWSSWGTVVFLLIRELPLPVDPVPYLASVAGVVLACWIAASIFFPRGKENMRRLFALITRMRRK